MINTLHRKKFGLSYSLMFTILGVFLLNLFCEIGIEPTSLKASASTHHSDEHSHDDGGHSGDHSHGTHGDDNCCGDVTSQFFSQLIKEKVPSYTFQSATKVLLFHAATSLTEQKLERDFSQLRYYHNLPPPFQDHSKQILFQTFLI
ncbi:hypothetical protein BXY85_1670 [Roseivirga pacifica]|jgi:hypothetical protein|uniref:Uncharacterized protein n=1 Tax=Roseivirga pacifica TaxID=1267423 RepID=A0A1I0MS21_9BACT|nr:hypothetical protein BXY85_1670 [Roseivirga pacifica]SEV91462.1 hypothetical protein SAMN05216290_0653 [Roseivirga pacifica]